MHWLKGKQKQHLNSKTNLVALIGGTDIKKGLAWKLNCVPSFPWGKNFNFSISDLQKQASKPQEKFTGSTLYFNQHHGHKGVYHTRTRYLINYHSVLLLRNPKQW